MIKERNLGINYVPTCRWASIKKNGKFEWCENIGHFGGWCHLHHPEIRNVRQFTRRIEKKIKQENKS